MEDIAKRDIDLVYTKEELDKPRNSVYGKTNGDLKRGLEFSFDDLIFLYQINDNYTYCLNYK